MVAWREAAGRVRALRLDPTGSIHGGWTHRRHDPVHGRHSRRRRRAVGDGDANLMCKDSRGSTLDIYAQKRRCSHRGRSGMNAFSDAARSGR